jgi:thiamine biosynthesis lipoprotein
MHAARHLFPLLVTAAVLSAGCAEPTLQQATWSVYDGSVEARAEIHAYAERDALRAIEEIRESLVTVEEKMLSAENGALAVLNREAAADYHVVEDQDLYRCVLLALDYAKVSMGAFDPTVGSLTALYERHAALGSVPSAEAIDRALSGVGWQNVAIADERRAFRFRRPGMALDLGGVAKGFSLDVAARTFARPGILGGVVQVGGNAYAWGEALNRSEWVVAIPDPRDPGHELLRIRTANRGIAVSGHRLVVGGGSKPDARPVLDPETGRPAATDLLAAVGIADSAADADALSTALFVAGSMRGAELLKKMRRVEAVLVVRGDETGPRILASASLRGRLELSSQLAGESDAEVRYLLPPQAL